MIKKYSKRIANLLINYSGTPSKEQNIEIYIYGLECFFNTLIPLILLVIWGISSKTLIETFCWISSFCIFRHYAGGFHASTQLSCILSSTMLGISNYFICEFQIILFANPLFITGVCLFICILFSPVDSGKIILSPREYYKRKIISSSITIIGIAIYLITKNNIGISIIYAFFCGCMLIILSLFCNKKEGTTIK